MSWDVTSLLLPRIRQGAYITDSHPTYTSAVLLSMADDLMVEDLLPDLHRRGSEYGVATYDQAIVAGTDTYRMPPRALFGVLRDVLVLDAQGVGRTLPWLELEQADLYVNSGGAPYAGYVVQGETVRLLPEPTQSIETLRMRYLRRPGRLVAPDASSTEQPHTITANPTSTTITIGTHGFDQGDLVDFVQATPPFDVLAQDVPLTAVAATTITIGTAITTAVVGDYVSTAGESAVPCIPAELHPLLARAVAVQVLEESGSTERYVMAAQKLEAARERIMNMLAPRVRGTPQRLVNPYSTLGRQRAWRGTVT